MESYSTKNIKNTLNQNNLRPSKGLGQNFLIDKTILSKIIKAADIEPTDIILEIGPGMGVLTRELAKRAKTVIAVEKDRVLCQMLRDILRAEKINNVEVINKDVLQISNFQFLWTRNGLPGGLISNQTPNPNYKIVSNLPYYITSSVIRKFLEIENPPKMMVLMVQKEVAQRICARPPKMNLLAVSVQFYANPKIISYVSKKSFWPSPKVDSAIIKITPGRPTSHEVVGRRTSHNLFCEQFFKIVKAGFSHPRKQLVNNLIVLSSPNGVKLEKDKLIQWLSENKINPEQRAESLNITDWINLTKTFELK